MQKNTNLIWARTHAGLTQAEAAAKMRVRRETFSRWETGRLVIPPRKLCRFLNLVNIPERALPKAPIEYDATGYPVGWVIALDGEDASDAALEVLEGDEYTARERNRYLIVATRLGGRMYSGARLKDFIAEEMFGYDATQAEHVARMAKRDAEDMALA